MSKSMFNREIDFKMEQTHNSFIACRSLSIRARDINQQGKQQEMETGNPLAFNPTSLALTDYSQGVIDISNTEEAKED
ncbi:MAG: hypothetical protein GKR89_09085 [Candidatus Latescibacteria bacterium]|nr:hypothetical protein [Candidatus Latescibacterota bacterium]